MDASTPALLAYDSPVVPHQQAPCSAAPAPMLHYYQPVYAPPPQLLQQQQQQRPSITDMPRRITPLMLLNPVHLAHIAVATAALPFKRRNNLNPPATDSSCGSVNAIGQPSQGFVIMPYQSPAQAWPQPASAPLKA